MDLVDRRPDFYRSRSTRCAGCGHEQAVDTDWLVRWSHLEEVCPGCRADCTDGAATRLVTDSAEPALDDNQVLRLSWWHTSTESDWPSADFDPLARLSIIARQRMGGQEAAERWAIRQKRKALHVGTYEAAVQNMMRRMERQGDADLKFYLYRVRLRQDLAVAPGCREEFVNLMGDVALSVACPPGVGATRYLNTHEDPGGVSLALGRGAMKAVQRIEVPLDDPGAETWRPLALARLMSASAQEFEVEQEDDELARLRRKHHGPTMSSERAQEQLRLRDEVTEHLPAGIRDQVRAAVGVSDTDPRRWCDRLAAFVQLIDDPEDVIKEVRAADWRTL